MADDFTAFIRASGSVAEMGAAAEGASRIDHAARGVGVKQRAGSVGALWQLGATCGPESLGSVDSFAFGEHWYLARDLKTAALGLKGAVALRGISGEVIIDLFDDARGFDHLHMGVFTAGEWVSSAHGK